MTEPTCPPPSRWLLLSFRASRGDAYDCEALVLTTRDRWERAQAVLRGAYPLGAGFYADVGGDEEAEFTAESFIAAFKVHEVPLSAARALAAAVGSTRPKHAYAPHGRALRVVSLEWLFVVARGRVARVPDVKVHDWASLLAFRAPPARCLAHGNVVGECDLGRGGAPPHVPPCVRSGLTVLSAPDPDYDALVGEPRTFEEVWAQKEREGYQYGREALENVRFGWELRELEEVGS